jgi:DNA polymerase-3 subunit epsilon
MALVWHSVGAMPPPGPTFVAIDFETADRGPDSACAVGLVRVESGAITQRAHRLIRPPRALFEFTWLHGISWDDVADQPAFGEVWRQISPMLEGAEFLAAHNAPFDRGVLGAGCRAAGMEPPDLPFRCTVIAARRAWGIRPTRLDNVCRELGIPLRHHEALSDAEACARIMIAAMEIQAIETAAAEAASMEAETTSPAASPDSPR